MKSFLFVQTAFAYHQVALYRGGEMKLWEQENSRETLHFLMRVLQEISNEPIEGIIFIVGPGAFTSLRVGATWVNTLAYVKDIPMYSLNTLEYVSRVLGNPTDSFAITYDEKRFFSYDENNQVCESNENPKAVLITPNHFKIPLHKDALEKLTSYPLTKVPLADVLYVVPPKITQPKKAKS